MQDLHITRAALDAVDREIVRLFEERIALARAVAAYKLAHDLPVLDRSREEIVLASRCSMLQDGRLAPGVRRLFEELMALSRAEQEKVMEDHRNA